MKEKIIKITLPTGALLEGNSDAILKTLEQLNLSHLVLDSNEYFVANGDEIFKISNMSEANVKQAIIEYYLKWTCKLEDADFLTFIREVKYVNENPTLVALIKRLYTLKSYLENSKCAGFFE